MRSYLAVGVFCVTFSFSFMLNADEAISSKKMNNKHLAELIKRLDKNVKGKAGYWTFNIEGKTLHVLTDEKANRMRIISPVGKSAALTKKNLYRLMQANFDSALDARYSIAKDIVWSTYLHPLASLTDKEFIVAVGQVVNLATTFGSSYSSGLLIFQGGDSKEIQRRNLIDQLLEKGLTV